jgi:hypothetical protein
LVATAILGDLLRLADGENAIRQTAGRKIKLLFGKLDALGAFDFGKVNVNDATNAVEMPIAASASR